MPLFPLPCMLLIPFLVTGALWWLDANAVCTIRWDPSARISRVGERLVWLTRGPKERAVDASLEKARANGAANSRADSAAHLVEERQKLAESQGTPIHRVAQSSAPQVPPANSNGISGSLDPTFHDAPAPALPPRNFARADTLPDLRSPGQPRTDFNPRSASTSEASATNPGHNALSMIGQLSSPRKGAGDQRGSDRDYDLPGPNKYHASPLDDGFDSWRAANAQQDLGPLGPVSET